MKLKKVIFLILIIINCITIFYFSNQVADTSSTESRKSCKLCNESSTKVEKHARP